MSGPRRDVRAVLALRLAWYAAMLLIPTFALFWAREDPVRWTWLVCSVLALVAVSSPLSRGGMAAAIALLAGVALAVRWLLLP